MVDFAYDKVHYEYSLNKSQAQMNVGELIKELSKIPRDVPVFAQGTNEWTEDIEIVWIPNAFDRVVRIVGLGAEIPTPL